MSDASYRPVSCGLHSEYELLAMRRAPVTVHYRDEAGAEHRFRGRVVDLLTRDGAEFMRLESERGTLEVRLDRIERLRGL
jgi:Transcriptional antiterminator